VLLSPFDPRRSGDANVLGDNDRAHLHDYANDSVDNGGTPRNPDRNLARNRDGDDGGRYEPGDPGLVGSLTT
jgi:hypothetical protein